MLSYLLSIGSALAISVGWWFPGLDWSVLLGWVGTILLCAGLQFGRMSYKAMLLHGCICNTLGFYWLHSTIKDFGGLPLVFSAPIFLFFVFASANQQLIFLWLFKHLPQRLHRLSLATAIAWVCAEFISIRIFPWSVGHMQLAFEELAQFADVLGVAGVTFLLFWVSDALLLSIRQRGLVRSRAIAFVTFALALVYGDLRLRQFEKIEGPGLQVALVQGNVSIAEKHDIKYFTLNRQRYLELSEIAAKPGTLVIWPESVLNEFVPDSIENVLDDKRLPYFGPKVGVLFGGLTYKSEQEYFNSAIAVLPSGLVLPPYHKQILMPFGEFTPFSDSLPWLKEINHTAGNFTPGRKQAVFQYPLGENGAEIGVAPLICYEDIVPAMALQAVRAGAQILVNLTNDAWFGDTVAPAQHHLIAAWRAIENRRYLLRSTNAGLTAVVSPTGQTIAALPTFEEGLLIERVHPLNAVSPYNTYFGASFELCVLAFAFASIAGFWLRRRFSSR